MESDNQSETPLAYKKMNTRRKTLKLPSPNLSDDQSDHQDARRKKVFKAHAKSKKAVQRERTKIYTKTPFEENYSTFLKMNIIPKFDDLQNVFQKFLELKPVVFENQRFACELEQLNLFNRKYEVIERCLQEIESFKAKIGAGNDRFSDGGDPFVYPEVDSAYRVLNRNDSNQICEGFPESTCNKANVNKSDGNESVSESKLINITIDSTLAKDGNDRHQKSFIKRPSVSIETLDPVSEKRDTRMSHGEDHEIKPTSSPDSTKKQDASELTEQDGLVEDTAPISSAPILKTKTFVNCDLRYFNFSLLTANLGSFDGRLISYYDGPSVADQGRPAKRQLLYVWQQQVLSQLQYHVEQRDSGIAHRNLV